MDPEIRKLIREGLDEFSDDLLRDAQEAVRASSESYGILRAEIDEMYDRFLVEVEPGEFFPMPDTWNTMTARGFVSGEWAVTALARFLPCVIMELARIRARIWKVDQQIGAINAKLGIDSE
ncbi:MAG: hypothetical protein JXQ29_12305 [Planctomycetes bacterium]|nr:hypothetical protein [Planctomycetota bacterium]